MSPEKSREMLRTNIDTPRAGDTMNRTPAAGEPARSGGSAKMGAKVTEDGRHYKVDHDFKGGVLAGLSLRAGRKDGYPDPTNPRKILPSVTFDRADQDPQVWQEITRRVPGADKRGFVMVSLAKNPELEPTVREGEQAVKDHVASIKSGATPVTAKFRSGEYLDGYEVRGAAADLLIEMGAARDVMGWGVLLRDNIVKALGENFTIPQVLEFLRPEREAKEAKQKAKQDAADAKRKAAFDEARRTGRPVAISSRTEIDPRPDIESDLTMHTEYAMPDGTTQTRRSYAH